MGWRDKLENVLASSIDSIISIDFLGLMEPCHPTFLVAADAEAGTER